MTTENSRADALTNKQRAQIEQALRNAKYGPSRLEVVVSILEDVLAASPVSQPAAAPIDECELCHSSGYMDETLGGALPGVPDAPCMNGCKATEQTAPSPADERAALAKLRAEMFDWLASCTKEHIDGKIEFINRVTEGFAAIYARAAASPAAGEAAQPSLTNPLTPYGMLVRALRIVTGTVLGDMAQHLGYSPAALSAVEFGRKPLTAVMVADTAAYFASVGIPDTLHALSAAWRAHALVDGADHAA
ncbi:TPA: hypothetical protein ACXM9H_002970 [Burkholderia multivorans]